MINHPDAIARYADIRRDQFRRDGRRCEPRPTYLPAIGLGFTRRNT